MDCGLTKMPAFDYTTTESQLQISPPNNLEKKGGYVGITPLTRSPSPSRRRRPRRKITLLEKIGVWNCALNLTGSLVVLGILIFLWFLVSCLPTFQGTLFPTFAFLTPSFSGPPHFQF